VTSRPITHGSHHTRRIWLHETGPGVVEHLTGDQVAALLAVPGAVKLAPATGGRWRLTGHRRVGLLRITPRTGEPFELHIKPKIPVPHLLFLLGYAPQDPWQPDPVTVPDSDDLLPAMADLFALTARRTLDTGILHGYRTVEEDLPLVRGRIRTGAQLRRAGLPLPVSVEYDDHTRDIAENRILLAALHRTARVPGIAPTSRTLLRHLANRLTGVQRLPSGSALPRWTPNRLNARYRRALRLAELILTDRSVHLDAAGRHSTDGFLLDLAPVFESFLTAALSQALRPHRVSCKPQDTRHRLDEAGIIPIRPDLLLHRGGEILTVIDAKYINLTSQAPPTGHMYQLLSYCTVLGLPHGHLVYATAGSTKPTQHVIRNSGTAITAHVLDMTLPPKSLLHAVTDLAAETVKSMPVPGAAPMDIIDAALRGRSGPAS
jgi:5-methylcytosine-specific restriction enzyme subunit McrC